MIGLKYNKKDGTSNDANLLYTIFDMYHSSKIKRQSIGLRIPMQQTKIDINNDLFL